MGCPSPQGLDDRLRRVAGHCPGITKAEVGIAVAVNVDQFSALGALDEDWKATRIPGNRRSRRPFVHPVHRHPADERLLRLLVELGRARSRCSKTIQFGTCQLGQLIAVNPRLGLSRFISISLSASFKIT